MSLSNVEFRVFGDSSERVATDGRTCDVISAALNQFGALFEKC